MPYIDLGAVVGPQGEQGATGAQGIRGEQGLPGPNQVTNSTATPLTGILTGNGSFVGVASIDEAPTADSMGFARSGGTKIALDAKANQAQLAYVENGTTASQNYTAGQYICWNGLLHTANQAISSGATLSAGTGGNLTECVGGGFNNLFVTKTFTITVASIRQYYFVDGTSDITVDGYVPIAINTFDVYEDHCILQKLGFVSNNINTLYYRIKNYDSTTVANVIFVVRVLYARASLIQL